MRIFVTTETSDDELEHIELYEIDVADLVRRIGKYACLPAWDPRRDVVRDLAESITVRVS